MTDLANMVAPILAVLSKSDYGDTVTVVLDASDENMQGVADDLRDAGARVRWFWRKNSVHVCSNWRSCGYVSRSVR